MPPSRLLAYLSSYSHVGLSSLNDSSAVVVAAASVGVAKVLVVAFRAYVAGVVDGIVDVGVVAGIVVV
jgi:hypothetical protein